MFDHSDANSTIMLPAYTHGTNDVKDEFPKFAFPSIDGARNMDSPVDSTIFLPVYNHNNVKDELPGNTKLPLNSSGTVVNVVDVAMKPLPSLMQARAQVSSGVSTPLVGTKDKHCVVYDCELEPFEYRPGHPSLNSVFGDQDLVDAIMFSLGGEQSQPLPTAGATSALLTPRFLQPQQSVLPAVRPRVNSNKVVTGGSLAPLRKPGTFLNKDGRWIKGKPCRMDKCDKRAQSNGLCKGHGGGARCSFQGCAKSSQGGGFCRAHGGGKRCMHEGCDKGTQRNGFCYLHGGVRSCSVEGCDKKDRGNGKCFSHGGGRKCQSQLCFNTIRRGMFCDEHSVSSNSRVTKKC